MRIFLKHPRICIHWDTQREMIHWTRTWKRNYQGTEEDMEIKKVISQIKSQLESYEIEFRQSPGKKNQEIETENMNNMKHS